MEDGTDADIEAAAAEPISDESVLDLLSSKQVTQQKQTQTDDNVADTIVSDEGSSPTKRLVRDVMDTGSDKRLERYPGVSDLPNFWPLKIFTIFCFNVKNIGTKELACITPEV